jgi:hypothetical protein
VSTSLRVVVPSVSCPPLPGSAYAAELTSIDAVTAVAKAILNFCIAVHPPLWPQRGCAMRARSRRIAARLPLGYRASLVGTH